ncbi:hypothetical protein [Helicobacter sp. MIT 14-3879]|uniref:hypothetical protein n=1 Tax=Helicobacter sp. MIT 14-3879 TaxID=2040649 RepID=UPI000E1E7E1D|nr:hypothetical protein [Helicobacter sp. MIT 14-3879]RDU59032.1 hypothetical protein CQA44_11790 [Helicobacter sp. MIT 14-3879]
MKLYQKYYTLGVYVDTWGLRNWRMEDKRILGANISLPNVEWEGVIPHTFLGLKIEYQLVNENFNGILNEKYKKEYALESDLKDYNKTTQMDLIQKLTKEYNNTAINKKKWQNKTDENIYKEIDKDYLFFRQGYKDITIPVKQYFKNAVFFNYQAYEKTLKNFIQSEKSNIQDIEGFFGFAPYKSSASHWGKVFNNQYKSSAPLRTSSYDNKESGGKVFQNNQFIGI